jgi:hypothetical protein
MQEPTSRDQNSNSVAEITADIGEGVAELVIDGPGMVDATIETVAGAGELVVGLLDGI